ncbi:MAG: AAA family ATPase, partial [Dehalococcoidia bacterium]
MRKRLLIAMALVHDPAVIFLDEPTSGLDVQSSILVRAIIRRLNSDGATIFLTTHQMEEANQTCDRVAIIDHGRIACIDAPENLRQAIESVQSVLVSFAQASDELERELAGLEGVLDMRKDGSKFRLFTKSPGALVPQIVDLARGHNTGLVSLNTAGPSLEDVFIKITGIDVSIGEGGKRNGVA